MSSPAFETFLARLYTDNTFLQNFMDAPQATGSAAGLNEDEIQSLLSIDQAGLAFAARSFANKRAGYAKHQRKPHAWWKWLMRR